MTTNNDDTICAIATVLGTGGISVIRISGKNSFSVAKNIFSQTKNKKETDFEANRVYHGYIFDNDELLDEVVLLSFKAIRGRMLLKFNHMAELQLQKPFLSLFKNRESELLNMANLPKEHF